jgi:hypothetical protein
MAANAAWKDFERRFAKKLKGRRLWRPDFSDSQPDGENGVFVWDTKCYQRHSTISLWVEAWRKYAGFGSGRPLLLGLFSREKPRAGDFVVIRLGDFTDPDVIRRHLAWLEDDGYGE